MTQQSFKKIAQMTRDTAEIAKQNEEIAANLLKDVQMKAKYLEIERMKFEADKHADIRHQVNQCVDFALKSLPWWNRGTKAVINRASELLLTIKHETAKHVAMDVLTQRVKEEGVEEVKAETEKVLDEIIEKDPVFIQQ